MTHVPTCVGNLHVEHHGDGPALLCWPSLFCDSRTMAPVVSELARDHRVILVDGPGHGRSGSSGRRFSLEDTADAAASVLDAAGVSRATWIGMAWGGHVGVAMALRHAPRLNGLVVMNAPMAEWSGKRRALFWFCYVGLRVLGTRSALATKVAEAQIEPGVRARHPDRVEAIVDCIRSSDRRGFFYAMRSAMLDRPSLLPSLGEISVPTLFLTGSADALFPVEVARRQAAAIPGARFAVVDGTAHLSLWEAPERVVPLLREHLATLGDAASAHAPAPLLGDA